MGGKHYVSLTAPAIAVFFYCATVIAFLLPTSAAQPTPTDDTDNGIIHTNITTYNGANLTLLFSLDDANITTDAPSDAFVPAIHLPYHSHGPNDTFGYFPHVVFATSHDHKLHSTDGVQVDNLTSWDPIWDTDFPPESVHRFDGRTYIAVGPSLYVVDATSTSLVFRNDDAGGFWIDSLLTFDSAMYFTVNATLYRVNDPTDAAEVETFPDTIDSIGAVESPQVEDEEVGANTMAPFLLLALTPDYVAETTRVYAVDANGTSVLLTDRAYDARILPRERNPVVRVDDPDAGERGYRALFSADNGLWRTGGTPESTSLYFDAGLVRFSNHYLTADGGAYAEVQDYAFTTKGTNASTVPLIPCDAESGMPEHTSCLNVMTHAYFHREFGEAGAFRGRAGSGPVVDGGKKLILSVGAGRGITDDMDVYVSDGATTEYVASIPDFSPKEGNRLPDGRLVVAGYRMNFEPYTDQIWILDGTEEGTYLMAEFVEKILDSTSGILESMDDAFVLVNTRSSLFRLNVPPRKGVDDAVTATDTTTTTATATAATTTASTSSSTTAATTTATTETTNSVTATTAAETTTTTTAPTANVTATTNVATTTTPATATTPATTLAASKAPTGDSNQDGDQDEAGNATDDSAAQADVPTASPTTGDATDDNNTGEGAEEEDASEEEVPNVPSNGGKRNVDDYSSGSIRVGMGIIILSWTKRFGWIV